MEMKNKVCIMQVDSALKSGINKNEVYALAREALENNGAVKEAKIRSGVIHLDMAGNEKKGFEYDEGIAIQVNGSTRVFFPDRYDDRMRHVEVNLNSWDVNVRLGNSLNEEAYNYGHERFLKSQGKEVNKIREVLNEEILVENGQQPTVTQLALRHEVRKMHERYGTPREVHIPDNRRSNEDYQRLLWELKKLSQGLEKQYEFANQNNAMPKYKMGIFDMTNEHYKQFKRDVVKNVAMSQSHGMLFSLESSDEKGLSISMSDSQGNVLGSLNAANGGEVEYVECELVVGDPVEIEIGTLPDMSSMTQKGVVSDGFRDLASEMRKDIVVIKPVTEVSELISEKDIADALTGVVNDVVDSGKTPLVLGSQHQEILDAKLTVMLSQKYPDIVTQEMLLSNSKPEGAEVKKEFSQSLGMA
tara:strand:+ start:24689 stop:25936 length:1248 start_codon:yes stop_codon:yes gene_type:complete